MSFEFEALVGHLYVVGGRSISAQPPGALVEVAPKKAARGREDETFFTLVLPSGDVTAPTSFYEQMAQLAAESYFNTGSSVTSALRAMFSTLNENLVEHNTSGKRPYEANMLCAVLRGDDLIVGRVGAGVAVARLTGETKTFPENLGDDEALFGPPLGVQPVPDVRLTRYTVANGVRLLLGDVNLADISGEKLTNALLAPDITEVLASLKEGVVKQVTLLAVEFVPPEMPASVPVKEGTSSVEIAAATRTATSEMKQVTADSANPKPPRQRRKPLDEAAKQLQIRAKQGVGAAAVQTSRLMQTMDKTLDRLIPEPKAGQRKWISAPLLTAMVVFVPVIVVLLVVIIWLGSAGETEFEICLKETNSRANLARSIPSNNRDEMLRAWEQVLIQVTTCNRLREGDAVLARLRSEAQMNIDGLNQISRREALVVTPVRGAVLSEIVLQGSDLYVLDGENSQVYRVALASDGKRAASAPQPIPSMRRNALIGQAVVGEIVGITFDQIQNLIIALDRGGLVISCQPRFITECRAQRLIGVENWRNPVSVYIWNSRLYVLDPGTNQIYRYEQAGGVFGSPTEYFGGQIRPTLTTAVDFGIDEGGNVYILLADGVVSKYNTGRAQNFGFAGFPQLPASGTALFSNENAILPSLMVISQEDRTIYDISRAGTWNASYRVFDEDLFASLADVAADPSQRLMYAISGNAILVLER